MSLCILGKESAVFWQIVSLQREHSKFLIAGIFMKINRGREGKKGFGNEL